MLKCIAHLTDLCSSQQILHCCHNGLCETLSDTLQTTIHLSFTTSTIYTLYAKDASSVANFYARQHICYRAYMPHQFRPSVYHTRVLYQNG